MSFERRFTALERMFIEDERSAGVRERDERRAQWTALQSAVIDAHDRLNGNLEAAVRSAVSQKYADLDADEREQMSEELTLVFRYWLEEPDLKNKIRQDRRNLLPPALRHDPPGGVHSR